MINSHLTHATRRQFFSDCGIGLGKIALGSLIANHSLQHQAIAASTPLANQQLPAKVKRVIYLFMAGAPSQLELFDYKPKLVELEGKPIPPEVIKGQRYAFIQSNAAVLGPRFKFAKHGESGIELSEKLPHLAKVVDDIALVKSVHTDQFNHSPAQLFLNTGSPIPGRPAMGSWLSYGLGNESKNLPAFVVLKSGGSLSGGASMWSAGFLPSSHQGVPFRSQGDPILHVSNPSGFDNQAQRDSLDLIKNLNQQRMQTIGDPEIQSRIQAYEMAWRMQSAAPELMDFTQESQATQEMYGLNEKKNNEFAKNCLLARRMAERGVRFIQVYHSGWDHHSNVEGGINGQTKLTDQASAALIMDLKQRGLLEDTLVVWGGEFGRTPMVESSASLGRNNGRDHHPQAYSMWFAGGGVKSGISLGKTDELGFSVVDDPVHVHDVQATILHLLGIDHERLTFQYQGRPFRLTDVHGHVVQKLLS
ncbi:DUF1501 domain-containing protein [bacterium]|jgi:uncharacterized protein (DUF1501 family)|nr:DUF1501 domain-containing protein [bacterium]